MSRGVLFAILAVLLAISASFYQFYVSPIVNSFGYSYIVKPFGLNPGKCSRVHALQACEKIVLHEPTGVLYLACSTAQNRANWLPSAGRFDAKVDEDYVATFDPTTSKVTRLTLENFDFEGGISVHGMDVVASAQNPRELFVYLVNHRAPAAGQDASLVGADSVVEVFKTAVGGDKLVHQRTVQDAAIITPNDIAGFGDGERFYFTNDHNTKTGFARVLRGLLTSASSVGYCHLNHGCKIVAPTMFTVNGIVKAPNDTVYVASTSGMKVNVFEKQDDDSLVLLDAIPCGNPIDNLSMDKNSAIWAAGFPKSLELLKHIDNTSIPSSVSAWRFTLNTGPGSFYGEKYKVEKAFEDDGAIASGATTVVHDSERKLFFIHGIFSSFLTVCHTE